MGYAPDFPRAHYDRLADDEWTRLTRSRGYSPYNVAMLEKYRTIFRAVSNFVFVGDDGATPALRLGLTKQPLGLAT